MRITNWKPSFISFALLLSALGQAQTNPPTVSYISPESGPVGTVVTIHGQYFGATQGTSTVKFNGVVATPTSWSDTQIVAPVPTGATTGKVQATVNGIVSNGGYGPTFTVGTPPNVSYITPESGPVGTVVTIVGQYFGTTQGTSTVKFNGVVATPTSWSDTQIAAPVPTGATTGKVQATVNGIVSNGGYGPTFTVGTPPTISASVSPSPNASGWNNSNVTVTFTCTPGSSAISSCTGSQTVSSEGANQVVSGTATDTAGLAASTSVTLKIDKTPPALTVTSPAEGASFTDSNVPIAGTATDALSGPSSVTCNGASASFNGADFSCNISLAVGVNLIVVRATDIAGNVAALPLHLTLAGTLPPPTSLRVTPTGVNLLVGQTQQFTAVDEQGRPRNDATWTVSDTSLATITTDAEPVLTAVAVGQVTLTANVGGISAQVQVNILAGTSLPPGTVRWSAPPVPGFTTLKILQAVPASANTPDLYSIETDANGNSLIRAFTGDGRQMWQKSTAALGVLRDAIPDGFGGVLVVANFLSDFDGVTGIEIWRTDLSATWDTKFAIRQDGYVFLSPAGALSSEILALHPTTGAVLTRTALPTGMNALLNTDCILGADFFSPTSPGLGPLAIDSDGTVAWEVTVSSSTTSWFCPQGEPIVTISSSFELSLFRLSMDGALSTTSLTTQFAVPGNVIPDGRGGWLATWTAVPNGQWDASISHPLTVSHFNPQGSSQYDLNMVEGSNFPRNRDLVLGEDGTAFATDFSKVVAFNLNSGQVNWTYQAPATSAISIVASSAGNGLVAKLTDQNGLDTVVRLDSAGQATLDAWSGTRLDYEIGDQWLGFPSAGSAFPAFSAAPVEWSSSIWARPDQNLTNATTPKIQVRVFSVVEANVDDQTIRDRVHSAIRHWQLLDQILLNWDDTIQLVSACPPTNNFCDVVNDPDSILQIPDSPSDVTSRKLSDIQSRFPNRRGVNLIFTDFVFNPSTHAYTLTPLNSNPINIVIFRAFPQDVGAHELGHVFQLRHIGIVHDNLMCGETSSLSLGSCDPFEAVNLYDWQLHDAKKGSRLWW